MCKHPQILAVRLSVLPALSLVPLAGVSSWGSLHPPPADVAGPLQERISKAAWLRGTPAFNFISCWLWFCFSAFWGHSALPAFPERFTLGPLRWQHLPAWRGASVTVQLCFHPSLLPAAEVALAGAWLVILSEISFRLRIMMAKKEINFFYNWIPAFP